MWSPSTDEKLWKATAYGLYGTFHDAPGSEGEHLLSAPLQLAHTTLQELILSVLQAQPSARDSRFYLRAFAPSPEKVNSQTFEKLLRQQASKLRAANTAKETTATANESDKQEPAIAKVNSIETLTSKATTANEVVESILNPVHQHTALVKLQGPFTDRQLDSVAEGIIYLRKLGLVSIIVLDSEEWDPGLNPNSVALRNAMTVEMNRFVERLETRDARARPMSEGLFKVVSTNAKEGDVCPLTVETLAPIRSAIAHGEIPVIPPFALDGANGSLRLRPVPANDAVHALSRALGHSELKSSASVVSGGEDYDLTPLRMMIINREGGIPSPARGGYPHLSINLESEFDYINETFIWQTSAQDCPLKPKPNQKLFGGMAPVGFGRHRFPPLPQSPHR